VENYSIPIRVTDTTKGTVLSGRAVKRVRQPVKGAGWPNPTTAITSVDQPMWRVCAPHPGYWRRQARQLPAALQEHCHMQPVDSNKKTITLNDPALQDLLNVQPFIFNLHHIGTYPQI
jgi:hypothetical protein